MSRNILILGGCGFLGANLAAKLVANDENVTIFEHPAADTRTIDDILTKINLVRGDFTNSDDLEPVLRDKNIIFHLVSTTTVDNSTVNPDFDITTNLLPTIRLLQLAGEHGSPRVIFPSSGGTVYGPSNCAKISEEHKTDPISSYGIQKLAIEKYLRLFHHTHNLDFRILRFSNPYGPIQWGSQNQGIIGIYCQKIIQNKPIEIWGDGNVVRDYLYVDDAIEAFVKAMSTSSPHRLFNISSGIGTSVNDIITILGRIAGKTIEVIHKPGRLIDIPVNVLDPSLALAELAWCPAIKLEEGIERTFRWFLANQTLGGKLSLPD